MLEELEILARHGTVEAKSQLIDRLSDLMCTRVSSMSAKDSDSFGEVFASLVSGAPKDVRIEISSKAAALPEAPLRLLISLARDEIAVADSVLRHATGFGSVDLEALASALPATHLLSIATRPNLSEAITNRLVARGDITIWTALAENRSAKLSRSSLTTIVELAASDLRLRAALASRHDLPEPILDRLWPFMSLKHRMAVITAGFTLSYSEYDALNEAMSPDRMDADESVSTTDHQAATSEDIQALVENCDFITLANVLAARTGYSARFCLTLALGNYERGTVLLVRAANGNVSMLESLRKMRSRIGSRPTGERRGADRVYATVTSPEAQAILSGLDASFGVEAEVISIAEVKSKAIANAA
jgi:hypothetical protein